MPTKLDKNMLDVLDSLGVPPFDPGVAFWVATVVMLADLTREIEHAHRFAMDESQPDDARERAAEHALRCIARAEGAARILERITLNAARS